MIAIREKWKYRKLFYLLNIIAGTISCFAYFIHFSKLFLLAFLRFRVSHKHRKSPDPHSVRVDYLREIVEITIYVFAIPVSTIFSRLFLPATVAFRLQER